MSAPAVSVARYDFAGTRLLALAAIDSARSTLNDYARETDTPEPGIVEAADYLDHARDALAGA